MRILFIENRSATLVWQRAASALADEGHEIHWMVQNHMYAPKSDHTHLLPYPTARDLSELPLDSPLNRIARGDRGLLHFGRQPTHYRHYWREVRQVIDNVAPAAVFGEATNFHELMSIATCKERGIPYIAPVETRYPAGRICFHRYDSLEPLGGCARALPEAQLQSMIEAIVRRDLRPAYMDPPKASTDATLQRVLARLRLTLAWLQGERYLTPSPLRHLSLNRRRRRTKALWDALAKEHEVLRPAPDTAWVLYPLQMQPESNIDVFGQPWNDQVEIVTRAARALAAVGAKLVVKPNPKSKYEMTPSLLEAVRSQPNIVVLAHSEAMAAVFRDAPLVMTVTGTVILESIFNGKPIAVLGKHHMAMLPGATAIEAPEGVAEVLQDTMAGCARRATRDEAEALLQHLHETSYEARLFDPVINPGLLRSDRMQMLQAAFVDVFRRAARS